MDQVNKAGQLFSSGLNCSQSVVGAFAEDFNIKQADALKMAAGFGGGMRLGRTCGALTGAFMVLGIKYGATEGADKISKAKTYEKVLEAASAFKEKFGATNCHELLGFEYDDIDGQSKAKTTGANKNCCDYVKGAAKILQQMLQQD